MRETGLLTLYNGEEEKGSEREGDKRGGRLSVRSRERLEPRDESVCRRECNSRGVYVQREGSCRKGVFLQQQ